MDARETAIATGRAPTYRLAARSVSRGALAR